MQAPVRELERAALEAAKRGAAMPLAAAAQRRGPEPSAAEVVEALQDAWWAAGAPRGGPCRRDPR
jgi:hypothetical protein